MNFYLREVAFTFLAMKQEVGKYLVYGRVTENEKLITTITLAEAHRLARDWDAAHPREP